MPSVLSKYISEPVHLTTSNESTYEPPHRTSTDDIKHPVTDTKALLFNGTPNGTPKERVKEGRRIEGVFIGESDGINASLQSLPHGRTSDSTDGRGNAHSRNGSKVSMVNGNETMADFERRSSDFSMPPPNPSNLDGKLSGPRQLSRPKSPESGQFGKGYHKGHARAHSSSAPQNHNIQATYLSNVEASPNPSEAHLSPQDPSSASKNRFSSPAVLPNAAQAQNTSSTTSLHPGAPRLHHRHTLEVPRISTSRTSRDFSYPGTASEAGESGRFSPTPRTPRASNTLARAPTRSIHSDMNLDEIPADSDMAKWTESIRQKRASRRKRKEEEDDDRVVVGTKVDVHHVNWVTAYNMLTGIRFTVSRTNAKLDRELQDSDFDAKHKLSFDM